jgi:hypothetical protein
MRTDVMLILLLSVLSICDHASADSDKETFLSRFIERNPNEWGGSYKIPTYEASRGSGLSRSDFEKVVRRGIPSLFTNVAADESLLRGLSCADFSNRWPNASMRAEYTDSPEGEVMMKLGDSKWINETRTPLGVNNPSEDCDNEESKNSRPEVAPFVWHVKDRVARTIKAEISNMYKGLPFLEHGSLLDHHVRDSFEFWFQQVGAGTFAHNDGYCHSVFSVQLRGKKKWRLMLAPNVENLSRDVFDEFDSGIYTSVHKWEPDLEVMLNEGDGILFPPGYMHETRTVDGPSEEDRCATSVTFNIPLPMPSRFIREFMPRFSVSREIHQCMRRWESFVTGSVVGVDWEEPVADSDQSERIATDIFSKIDSNKDGKLTITEIETYFFTTEDGQKFKKKKSVAFGDVSFVFDTKKSLTEEMYQEALKVRAKDTLDMWDVNEDGFAVLDEVRDVIDFFQFYRWRQELVDSALTVQTVSGEIVPLPIGSELFSKRLELVDKLVQKIRSEPPVLDKQKYPPIVTGKDEL